MNRRKTYDIRGNSQYYRTRRDVQEIDIRQGRNTEPDSPHQRRANVQQQAAGNVQSKDQGSLWGFNDYSQYYSNDRSDSSRAYKQQHSQAYDEQRLKKGRYSSPAQPCTTLFVANIPSDVEEDEVKELFSNTAGYKHHVMHTDKDKNSVYFVEYGAIEDSTSTLKALNGYEMRPGSGVTAGSESGGNGGLRIEYAKSKMGDTAGGKRNPMSLFNNGNGDPLRYQETSIFAYPPSEHFVSYSLPYGGDAPQQYNLPDSGQGFFIDYASGDHFPSGSDLRFTEGVVPRELASYIESGDSGRVLKNDLRSNQDSDYMERHGEEKILDETLGDRTAAI